MQMSSLEGMTARRWLGSERSHSAVVTRVVGEMQGCTLPKSIAPSDSYAGTIGSYANTLDPVNQGTDVAATILMPFATVTVDALRTVSYRGLFPIYELLNGTPGRFQPKGWLSMSRR